MNLHFSNHSLLGGLSALLIATLLAACSQVPASREPRAPATVTRQDWSAEVSEPSHNFQCPKNQALIGRFHWGAEDKPTKYRCGKIFQYQDIEITDVYEYKRVDEHEHGNVICPENEVMVGRGHLGDEEGETWYYCGKPMDYWGYQMHVAPNSEWIYIDNEYEHGGPECADNQVLVGRFHWGDETKPTKYLCATLY